MNGEFDELNVDQLSSVTGGGIADNVAAEAEASTSAFLKRFAEASQRFSIFLNTPTSVASAAANQ